MCAFARQPNVCDQQRDGVHTASGLFCARRTLCALRDRVINARMSPRRVGALLLFGGGALCARACAIFAGGVRMRYATINSLYPYTLRHRGSYMQMFVYGRAYDENANGSFSTEEIFLHSLLWHFAATRRHSLLVQCVASTHSRNSREMKCTTAAHAYDSPVILCACGHKKLRRPVRTKMGLDMCGVYAGRRDVARQMPFGTVTPQHVGTVTRKI